MTDFFIGGGDGTSPELELARIMQGLGYPLRPINDTLSVTQTYQPVAVNDDYVTAIGEFLTVTCTNKDITITLPDVLESVGHEIYVYKADATAFLVKTVPETKDLSSQNSVMHLVSNGTEWVIS